MTPEKPSHNSWNDCTALKPAFSLLADIYKETQDEMSKITAAQNCNWRFLLAEREGSFSISFFPSSLSRISDFFL